MIDSSWVLVKTVKGRPNLFLSFLGPTGLGFGKFSVFRVEYFTVSFRRASGVDGCCASIVNSLFEKGGTYGLAWSAEYWVMIDNEAIFTYSAPLRN